MSGYLPVFPPRRPEDFRFSVREAGSRGDMRRVAGFPRYLYRGDRYATPRTARDLRRALSPAKNPALAGLSIGAFVAEATDLMAADRVVGTVVALIDPAHNRALRWPEAFFSQFEVVNRQEVATALLEAVELWIRERLPGAARIVGPVNLQPHWFAGVLEDGFNARPAAFMPYNLPYYPELLAVAGLTPIATSLAVEIPLPLPAAPSPAPDQGEARYSCRPLADVADLPEALWPLARAGPVHDRTGWRRMTLYGAGDLAAFRETIRPLVAHLDSATSRLVVDATGTLVACGLVLNPSRSRVRKLWPRMFGHGARAEWLQHRVARGTLMQARLWLLGSTDRAGREIWEPLLYREILVAAAARGYRSVEVSPVPGEDTVTSRFLAGLGGCVRKRYSLYEKVL